MIRGLAIHHFFDRGMEFLLFLDGRFQLRRQAIDQFHDRPSAEYPGYGPHRGEPALFRLQLVFQVLNLVTLFKCFGLERPGFGLALLVPAIEYHVVLFLLPLLFELLCKPREFALAVFAEPAKLVENRHVMHPVRVCQQVLKVIELLLDACCPAFLLFDPILQAILLLPHAGKLFLELGAVPVQLHQLFAVFRLFVGIAEDRSQAGQ